MYILGWILMIGGIVGLLFMPISTNMLMLGVVIIGAALYVGSLIDTNSDHRENSDRFRHADIMKALGSKESKFD